MLRLKKKQSDFETRKEYLIYIAINFLREHAYEYTAFYDEAECDGTCLADDLRIEFDVPEHLIESWHHHPSTNT